MGLFTLSDRCTTWIKGLAPLFIGLGAFTLSVSADTEVNAVQIEFDYSFDEEGFFDDPARRELVELAAKHVNRYVDQLDAIIPSEGNSWFTFPPVPPSGSDMTLRDMEIAADTMKVIVGGNSVLPVLTLSQTNASPASPWIASTPTQEWADLLASRGQAGALESPPTDFGNWGGVININSDDVDWHFGKTTEGLEPNETDFLTLVMHELTHIMGFGPSDSFGTHVDFGNLTFTGPEALSVGSGNNPTLELNDGGHWAAATLSFAGGAEQTALMTPYIYPGQRKYPTLLDRAALRDVGWEEARPGDANLDRQYDTLDIVAVSQAAKYRTGDIAAWSEGDWNDDFRFDQNDIILSLSQGTYLTGPYAAVASNGQPHDGRTSVLYDASTGEVSVETPDGVALTSLNIDSASGIFTSDPSEHTDGVFDVDEDTSIFKATLGSSFGSLSFGPIAAAGLDEAFLWDDLTVTGSLEGGGTLQDVDLIYLAVPEPTACGLALVAFSLVLGMARPRRRPATTGQSLRIPHAP